ncbi:MAG TPA: hypothetical protein K8W17_04700 [Lapidilactobacillus dextrinicus]|uniref:Uncharacterized protein n=1 Tax=Lapidilactobacillus dextrinicus TaxID=51664 RepID=A0A921DVL8_9LACO|nr:hypothetical protein [Lapidilactobacillus dextrinicus]HJE15359.1 hypothetical protein [Lapidilactobacillus dextrinicus]
MEKNELPDFPTTEFAAFSTAKMSYFLPYTSLTTVEQIKTFFGEDFGKKADVVNDQLVVLGSEGWEPVQKGLIIAKFTNNKYKIIDVDYYRRDFNDPIIDSEGKGIY